jgi:hypothetical protein
MTDFISQISSAQTLSAVLFILVLVVGMLGIIIWQQLRIKKMKGPEQPKYGFLGKPLYSVLAIAVLAGGVGLTWYNLSHGTEQVTVQADETVKVDVTYEVKETETGKQTASKCYSYLQRNSMGRAELVQVRCFLDY